MYIYKTSSKILKINKGVSVASRHVLSSFSKFLSIDWCHLVDRHRPTAWDTTRKLVVPQAVGANQPNDTSLQHLGFICEIFVKSSVQYHFKKIYDKILLVVQSTQI